MAAFDSIPANKYDYKPTPPQQSIGFIAQHLESANYDLCSVLGTAKHIKTAKDSLADTVKARWPKDTLVARLRASLIFCRDVLAPMTDAQLAEEITVHFPGTRTARAARTLRHSAIHGPRGTLRSDRSYMSLLGMIPPSALPRQGGERV